jgi:CheY-like chemotaxis protein
MRTDLPEVRNGTTLSASEIPAPLPSSGPHQDVHDTSTRMSARGNASRILLVEDNQVNQRLAVRMLKKRGHEADVAENGFDALKLLSSKTYDLILMDCQMPEMDGFETTRRIRTAEVTTGLHIPIVAMTANALPGDRERCIEAGMDEYIAKPVHAEMLYQMIEAVIVRHAPNSAAETPRS